MKPKSVVLQSWKKLQVPEKRFFRKIILLGYCEDVIFKMVLRFRKIVPTVLEKII